MVYTRVLLSVVIVIRVLTSWTTSCDTKRIQRWVEVERANWLKLFRTFTTTFSISLLFSFQIKMIVLLGEVGGIEEYDVCAALKDGRITKPLVAWCIGTCASELDNF